MTAFELRRLPAPAFYAGAGCTFGALTGPNGLLCFTLEDQRRPAKVAGSTCIPAGTYALRLREHGGFHARALKAYGPAWHLGMIELRDVPGFSDILIHTGNSNTDTRGCVLVGLSVSMDGTLSRSRDAYADVYPVIRDAILNGGATLTVSG
jgi:hypothetical protein